MIILEKYLERLNHSDLYNKLPEDNDNLIIYKTNRDRRIGLLRYNKSPIGKLFLFIMPDEEIINFHTIGMKFNIDILFYDKSGKLVSSYLNIKPGVKSISSISKIKYAIEVPQ